MAIHIRNAETEKLARELADVTGESIASVIKKSLQERLIRICGRSRPSLLQEDVQDILHRLDALPRLDARSDEKILDYDKFGAPIVTRKAS